MSPILLSDEKGLITFRGRFVDHLGSLVERELVTANRDVALNSHNEFFYSIDLVSKVNLSI